MRTRRDFLLSAAAGFGGLAMTSCAGKDGFVATPLAWADLPGWESADHESAARVFETSLEHARASVAAGVTVADWKLLQDRAARTRFADPRAYFEALFVPVLIEDGRDALFTAYFEPVVSGSRRREGFFAHPLHRRPADLTDAPYFTRAEIAGGTLAGLGLELVWLADPVEAFFLEIQGSGVVETPDGERIRVGFAGKNNHPYFAIGRSLVERGEMSVETATAEAIKTWLRAHPESAAETMNANPSYVFFEEKTALAPDAGPVGAMGVSVTAGRSAAIDPAYHPLAAPLWIEAQGVEGYEGRLMVAQDVGGAIKGAQRADLFIGTGARAGAFASDVRAGGRIVTLLPKSAVERINAAT